MHSHHQRFAGCFVSYWQHSVLSGTITSEVCTRVSHLGSSIAHRSGFRFLIQLTQCACSQLTFRLTSHITVSAFKSLDQSMNNIFEVA